LTQIRPLRDAGEQGIPRSGEGGAALDRNGLSVSTETACRFEPKSPVGNSEICTHTLPYRALGGEGGSLEAALAYSNVVFAGTWMVWLMNGLASAIRGTGNMLVPSAAICAGVVLLVPLSPCLIFGLGRTGSTRPRVSFERARW
jgi:hypothetical protein